MKSAAASWPTTPWPYGHDAFRQPAGWGPGGPHWSAPDADSGGHALSGRQFLVFSAACYHSGSRASHLCPVGNSAGACYGRPERVRFPDPSGNMNHARACGRQGSRATQAPPALGGRQCSIQPAELLLGDRAARVAAIAGDFRFVLAGIFAILAAIFVLAGDRAAARRVRALFSLGSHQISFFGLWPVACFRRGTAACASLCGSIPPPSFALKNSHPLGTVQLYEFVV